jgi:thiamine-monophosphate kinase
VLNALNTIADLNLTGYEVVQVPYLKKGLAAAKILSLPPIMLIAGECGEYELLFTISPEAEPEFKIESDDMGLTFHRLGTVTNGPRTLKEKGKSYSMENLILRARDYSDPKEYLRAMIKHLEQEGFHV